MFIIHIKLYSEFNRHSTIELAQHETCSVGIQCDLLVVAPLKKLPKGSATATIGYEIGVDIDTGDADVEADHNTRDADLDLEC